MNKRTMVAGIAIAMMMLAVPFAVLGSEDRSSVDAWNGGTADDYGGGKAHLLTRTGSLPPNS